MSIPNGSDPYYEDDLITLYRANALNLPLADDSVDLVVTSPPYFGLRSYQDGGDHYDGQIGAEATPAEFVDALIAATREMVRVTKPSGSIWVNLGDRYSGVGGGGAGSSDGTTGRGERPARRKVGHDMTREDAAWLAGVIDSDGSVSIHVNKQPEGNAPSFVAWTRIGQMRPEVVRKAAEVTGIGQVKQDARGVWNWSASAQQARWVLSRIYPWLTIKRRQAAAAIELARHVEDRNGRGAYRPLTSDDIRYRQRLKDAVNAWNRGEDDDLEPPTPARVPLPIYRLAAREKSLHGIPWQYAAACVGELGLILRAEVIWSKPNGLPESVTDRVRRSHEQWFHFTLNPRYYSAVDEVREAHSENAHPRRKDGGMSPQQIGLESYKNVRHGGNSGLSAASHNPNPLGKLPGSVWTVPTEPLRVPEELGIDHFAAFPTEFPRRIITGWSPRGVCVECGEGRRPVVEKGASFPRDEIGAHRNGKITAERGDGTSTNNVNGQEYNAWRAANPHTLTGEACDCPEPTAPTTPGVVLDPFSGTGTTALVASVLGRHGIGVDMSEDYCRLAAWRTTDPRQRARAARKPWTPPAEQLPGQEALDFGGVQ